MPVIGQPRTYQKRFAFVVEIDGVASAAFQNCSELQAEIAVVEQWEGGALTPDKSPGRVTVSDITLERGVAQDDDLYQWWLQVVNMSANTGLNTPDYKRPVDIVQLDRQGDPIRRWRVEGAWPMTFVGGAWDNEADENVIESVTLAVDTFDKVFG